MDFLPCSTPIALCQKDIAVLTRACLGSTTLDALFVSWLLNTWPDACAPSCLPQECAAFCEGCSNKADHTMLSAMPPHTTVACLPIRALSCSDSSCYHSCSHQCTASGGEEAFAGSRCAPCDQRQCASSQDFDPRHTPLPLIATLTMCLPVTDPY